MTPTIDNIPSHRVEPAVWSFATESPRDVIVVLSESLGPTWSVDRETDCQGEVSIIVLPIADDSKPAFVLYEGRGVARVAVVAEDDWKGDEGFACFQDAVAAVITACTRLTAPLVLSLSTIPAAEHRLTVARAVASVPSET